MQYVINTRLNKGKMCLNKGNMPKFLLCAAKICCLLGTIGGIDSGHESGSLGRWWRLPISGKSGTDHPTHQCWKVEGLIDLNSEPNVEPKIDKKAQMTPLVISVIDALVSSTSEVYWTVMPIIFRYCTSPRPSQGGKPCFGSDFELQPCVNEAKCRNCNYFFRHLFRSYAASDPGTVLRCSQLLQNTI